MLHDLVTEWMRKAHDDFMAGRAILTASVSSYETASFHAQQAAEKAIKALLVRHQVPFGKTHDLRDVLGRAEPLAPGIATALAEVHTLTPYAVPARYPGQSPPASLADATRHLGVAQRAVEHIATILETYLQERPDGG